MSIDSLREMSKSIAGAETLVMRYGRDADGKEIQIFEFDGKSFEMPFTASNDEILAEIRRLA